VDQNRTLQSEPLPEPVDERAIARKYGIRELVWPDIDQVKALVRFLNGAAESGKCGAVPKTAIVVMLDFLQGTLNRQNITKAPRMSPEEFDTLEAPYYLAARIISKLARDRHDEAVTKGTVYQTTHVTLFKFIDVLRALLDPACQWVRFKAIPSEVREIMSVFADFALVFPEQRRKGRAM
jgi:hypothetical protein